MNGDPHTITIGGESIDLLRLYRLAHVPDDVLIAIASSPETDDRLRQHALGVIADRGAARRHGVDVLAIVRRIDEAVKDHHRWMSGQIDERIAARRRESAERSARTEALPPEAFRDTACVSALDGPDEDEKRKKRARRKRRLRAKRAAEAMKERALYGCQADPQEYRDGFAMPFNSPRDTNGRFLRRGTGHGWYPSHEDRSQ